MTILYKYYSSYSENIFINPKLKLTPPSHLNDPFERKIPHGIEAIILESHLGRFITESQKANNIHDSKEHTVNTLEKTLGLIGITAMSENPGSILMWSHYADSHNGICIGYDISKINNEKMRLLEIDYSTKRFEPSDIIKDLQTLPSMIDTIIDKVVTTKSEQWSYENEHRYITKLNYANELLITVDKSEEKSAIDFLESQNQNKYLYDSLEITHKNNSTTIKAIIKNTIDPFSVEKLMKYKNISFYKNINQDCIKEIFIGCNSEIGVKDILSVLKDKNLMNIKVNKYKASDNEFKLEIINNN